jgi:hypothetical protein
MDRTAYFSVEHNDGYYTQDAPLFVGKFPHYQNEPRMIQGKLYVSDERYYTSLVSEIVPLQRREGNQYYVHMKPYVLEPQLFMNVGMYPKPKQYADQPEAIGEVLKTEVRGMRQHELGNAQAWYYPEEKTIVVWECLFERGFRKHPFSTDMNMQGLWKAFENWLIKQFPKATKIATPFNDPIAESIEEYQTFLKLLGYHPIAEAAFGKKL